ncbi:hypothetical protein [Streptomyces sp. NPDC001340]
MSHYSTACEKGEDLGPGLMASGRGSEPLGRYVEYLDGVHWFPRSCHRCTADRAHRALLDHSSFCPLCADADTAADCILGRGLYRLQRECRR